MITKKKKILIVLSALAICFILFIIADYYNRRQAVKAAGGFPTQLGLTGVTMFQCVVSCNGGCCVGGTLCPTKDPATCTNYQEVSGTPAGGTGNMALFSNTAISQAGLSQGGQLIAGCMSPPLCDNGVLASSGGCYGCMGRMDSIDKIKGLFKYVIAGFKDD